MCIVIRSSGAPEAARGRRRQLAGAGGSSRALILMPDCTYLHGNWQAGIHGHIVDTKQVAFRCSRYSRTLNKGAYELSRHTIKCIHLSVDFIVNL